MELFFPSIIKVYLRVNKVLIFMYDIFVG